MPVITFYIINNQKYIDEFKDAETGKENISRKQKKAVIFKIEKICSQIFPLKFKRKKQLLFHALIKNLNAGKLQWLQKNT